MIKIPPPSYNGIEPRKEGNMKIIVMSSPKALRRLLAKIFGVELTKKQS